MDTTNSPAAIGSVGRDQQPISDAAGRRSGLEIRKRGFKCIWPN